MNQPETGLGAEMDEALPRLLATFARAEFAAPAEAIAGLVALLVEDWDDSGSRDDVTKLAGATERLAALIARLLDPSTSQELIHGRDATEASSLLRHELRTPITAILGYGELLAEDLDEKASQHGILGDLLEAARRLLGQIDAMVEFMRLDRQGHSEEARRLLDPDAGLQEPVAAIRSVLMRSTVDGPARGRPHPGRRRQRLDARSPDPASRARRTRGDELPRRRDLARPSRSGHLRPRPCSIS